MKSSTLFRLLDEKRNQAIDEKNEIKEIYCGMHQLALLELQSANQGLTGVQFDKIIFDKEEYESLLNIGNRHLARFKRYVLRNATISFLLGITLFLGLWYYMHAPFVLSFCFGVLVCLIDLYMNGKTNDDRYKKYWIRLVNKNVEAELIEQINLYFK